MTLTSDRRLFNSTNRKRIWCIAPPVCAARRLANNSPSSTSRNFTISNPASRRGKKPARKWSADSFRRGAVWDTSILGGITGREKFSVDFFIDSARIGLHSCDLRRVILVLLSKVLSDWKPTGKHDNLLRHPEHLGASDAIYVVHSFAVACASERIAS